MTGRRDTCFIRATFLFARGTSLQRHGYSHTSMNYKDMYITLHCSHVDTSHVHCSKYTKMDINPDETPRERVEETDWRITRQGDALCELHS